MTELGKKAEETRLDHITQWGNYEGGEAYSYGYTFVVGDTLETISGTLEFPHTEDKDQAALFDIVPDINDDIPDIYLNGQIDIAQRSANHYKDAARAVTGMLGGVGVIGAGAEAALAVVELREENVDRNDVAVAGGGAALILVMTAGAALFFRNRELREARHNERKAERLRSIKNYLVMDNYTEELEPLGTQSSKFIH